jgi:hypothetical protein
MTAESHRGRVVKKNVMIASVKLSNSRGVHWRGEGGDQERELAQKYRKWGKALQVSPPLRCREAPDRLAKTYDHKASREGRRVPAALWHEPFCDQSRTH